MGNSTNSNITHDQKTIKDFSSQWRTFQDNSGYFISLDLLKDSLAGLVQVDDFMGKCVLDLGSGTGRIVRWIMQLGASHAYAVEPAETIEILKKNTSEYSEKITYKNCVGSEINLTDECDLAISLGVVSYIPEPFSTFKSVYRALKPGGKFFVLVMAKEGNFFYCTFVVPFRRITTKLSDINLHRLCVFLAIIASTYGQLCKYLPILPMKNYFQLVFNKVAFQEKIMLIFDQLNPSYAHYFKENELKVLYENSGFKDIKLVHRHGYSWAIIGTKA